MKAGCAVKYCEGERSADRSALLRDSRGAVTKRIVSLCCLHQRMYDQVQLRDRETIAGERITYIEDGCLQQAA